MQQFQLLIPEPCHENWDNMSPTQKGRFCAACAKEVIDFSSMTDAQVLHYFNTNVSGKVCGKVYTDQLNRTVALPAAPGRRWYWNYAIFSLLFLSKSSITKAQSKTVMPSVQLPQVKGKIKNTTATHFFKIISGTVKNEDGDSIPAATVKIKGRPAGISADKAGRYFLAVDIEDTVVECTAVGYKPFSFNPFTRTNYDIILRQDYTALDPVVIRSAPRYTLGGLQMRVTRITSYATVKATLVTVLTDSLKIYPNPAKRSQAFTVALKLKQPGQYTLQLNNAGGAIILQQRIDAVSKEQVLSLLADSRWAAGMYFIRIFDDKNALISKRGFIIQ